MLGLGRGLSGRRTAGYRDVVGTIVDENATPLAGAIVTVTGKVYGGTASCTTKDDGSYMITNVRIGRRLTTPTKTGPKVEIKLDELGLDLRVELAGYEIQHTTIAGSSPGDREVPKIALQRSLPPAQVRGIVRDVRGKPIADAVVSVSPGDRTAATTADGGFAIDLAPGRYKVKVHAPGFRDQELDVTVDLNGVALKEFVLRE
jgi:hypothetical protein